MGGSKTRRRLSHRVPSKLPRREIPPSLRHRERSLLARAQRDRRHLVGVVTEADRESLHRRLPQRTKAPPPTSRRRAPQPLHREPPKWLAGNDAGLFHQRPVAYQLWIWIRRRQHGSRPPRGAVLQRKRFGRTIVDELAGFKEVSPNQCKEALRSQFAFNNFNRF